MVHRQESAVMDIEIIDITTNMVIICMEAIMEKHRMRVYMKNKLW